MGPWRRLGWEREDRWVLGGGWGGGGRIGGSLVETGVGEGEQVKTLGP